MLNRESQVKPAVDSYATSSSSSSSPGSTKSTGILKSYKTSLCNKFKEQGWCDRGDTCSFAHGSSELRNRVRPPNYKTELCNSVKDGRTCMYGSKCDFAHDMSEVINSRRGTLLGLAGSGSRVALPSYTSQRYQVNEMPAGRTASIDIDEQMSSIDRHYIQSILLPSDPSYMHSLPGSTYADAGRTPLVAQHSAIHPVGTGALNPIDKAMSQMLSRLRYSQPATNLEPKRQPWPQPQPLLQPSYSTLGRQDVYSLHSGTKNSDYLLMQIDALQNRLSDQSQNMPFI